MEKVLQQHRTDSPPWSLGRRTLSEAHFEFEGGDYRPPEGRVHEAQGRRRAGALLRRDVVDADRCHVLGGRGGRAHTEMILGDSVNPEDMKVSDEGKILV